MGALEDAVQDAANFITPLLVGNEDKSGEQEFLDLLDRKMPSAGGDSGKQEVVKRALALLNNIHQADQARLTESPYDGTLVGMVYGLIDLLVLQGILPSLSSGVAFAQRPRSVLIPAASKLTTPDEALLVEVITNLLSVIATRGAGIEPLITQRALPDVISGVAELAFSPSGNQESCSKFQVDYFRLLDNTPTSRLLPVLSAFVQQGLPFWLRNRLSHSLSTLPLRPHGVRHTIEFIASSYSFTPPSQDDGEPTSTSQGPPIPLEAITQASRLLSSVPRNMEPEDWFTKLAPQLLELLDGDEGTEMSKAAGQIIASGILSRKSLGAPGTVGWKLFVEPLLQCLDPSPETTTHATKTVLSQRSATLEEVLVPEKELMLALRRLAIISSSHPHPGLAKRLVTPVLLPLWGVLTYTKRPRAAEAKRNRSFLDPFWSETVHATLIRYIKLSSGPKSIDLLAKNLFWDGGPTWTFGPGSEGGIEIRRRPSDRLGLGDMGGLITRIERMDEQVSTFVKLLSDGGIDDDTAGTVFLGITRRWLSSGRSSKVVKPNLTHDADEDPLELLTNAKLSEAMAQGLKDKFASQPKHIMELVWQLLDDFVKEQRTKLKRREDLKRVNYSSLENIVPKDSLSQISRDPALLHNAEIDSEDLVSFSLSLLNTLVTSSDFQRTPETAMLLSNILPNLQFLAESHRDIPISPGISNAARGIIPIVASSPTTPSTTHEDPFSSYRLSLSTALEDLTSPEPPNRAWALSTLRGLIANPDSSAIIDVPSIAHRLLSTSLTDTDSYIYTAVIPVLVALTSLAPRLVMRILVDAFIDTDERSIDIQTKKDGVSGLEFRLRIGEVLHNIILESGIWDSRKDIASRLNVLQLLTDSMLTVASRRGQRQKTLSVRQENAAKKERERAKAEEAWGGPIPSLQLEEEDETPDQEKEREMLERIVKGWEDTGVEEDVRLRTSPLSILGLAFEHRLHLMKQMTVDTAIEMALSVLVLETGDEKTILRRAAALVVMGLLRGMDKMFEEDKEATIRLESSKWEEVERVMKWVRNDASDEILKGHAESVLEGLETWRMKSWFGLRAKNQLEVQSHGLEGGLRGLAINPVQSGGVLPGKSSKIKEVR
ncbi:hypothetical protein K432DRAFT_1957 [Lepidopterella palustris CBS 459.81]|uniref:RNA polymerase II assembly factor Rtp1 C-terminal domain-containing protein n=1 Tax=Lepidopterella palustris CBS 459.81 TaxID=1314670 RepID=A0A8E2EM27_9PEZI|nr:hypothetical protein K432DRAFT_1957 [Lepidopterella palustris CBS 459.81]